MYAKLFKSMYDGTLATKGPWQALVTFQQMLIVADRFGVVDATPETISRYTTIPLDIIRTGIEELERADPDSRRHDHDGRRIVRLDPERSWGWQIVNYEHYSKIRSAEERREYQREYMREHRDQAKHKDSGSVVAILPLKGDGKFLVRESYAKQLEALYPKVDVPATLLEMQAWLVNNPDRRKTMRGARRFIGGWMAREQEKANGNKAR